jgi:hypothetical protein
MKRHIFGKKKQAFICFVGCKGEKRAVMELVRFIVGLSGDGASLINAFNGG